MRIPSLEMAKRSVHRVASINWTAANCFCWPALPWPDDRKCTIFIKFKFLVPTWISPSIEDLRRWLWRTIIGAVIGWGREWTLSADGGRIRAWCLGWVTRTVRRGLKCRNVLGIARSPVNRQIYKNFTQVKTHGRRERNGVSVNARNKKFLLEYFLYIGSCPGW